MLVIILRSTLCVVCMWHFLVLPTVVCACDNSSFYSLCSVHYISWFCPLWSVLVIFLGSTDCVVCMWHFSVLPTVVCACDNSWFYSLCCVLVAFLGSTYCGLCL